MNSGKIIILAFPDTFVKMSNDFLCKLLPFVGIGTKDYIKAGHAALVLIENKTGNANYYDFGRYVTPEGKGRVRGATTDYELKLNWKAIISESNAIINIDEILKWLSLNPEKTHGDGRLLASVCDNIDFKKAENYILNLQQKGSIVYSAFNENSSNCARFVADTILASTNNKSIQNKLNFNKKFTPSCIGNVEKGATQKKIYEVVDGEISQFQGTAFKENLKNYFQKPSKIYPDRKPNTTIDSTMHYLSGIGSSAYFTISKGDLPENLFRIKRFTADRVEDFDGVYRTSSQFEIDKVYEFTYDSHCEYCHILQNGKKIKFDFVEIFAESNSYKKEHLV